VFVPWWLCLRFFVLWPVDLGFQVTRLLNVLKAWNRISATRPREAALDAISGEQEITLFDHLPT
jgi:hypothetical protein